MTLWSLFALSIKFNLNANTHIYQDLEQGNL